MNGPGSHLTPAEAGERAATDPLQIARQLVLGWGLVASSAGPVALEHQQVDGLITWAVHERLDGVLWTLTADGELDVGTDDTVRIREAHTNAQLLTLGCEAVAAEVSSILSDRAISSWLLKGLAAGHLDYPHAELRSSVDTDILVSRSNLEEATSALVQEGYERVEPRLAPWWERRFARAIVLRSPDGVEVDLHAAVATGYFGANLDHKRLLELGGDPIDLGGVAAQGLAPGARLLSSAYAAVLSRGGHGRLHRDLLQQLLVTRCDFREAVKLASAGDGEVVLAAALRQAATAVGYVDAHPALAWAERVVPSRRAEKAMRLADAALREGWSADARSSLLALGFADKARFLAGAALPPRAHRRVHQRSVFQHLRQGSRSMRRPT